MVARAPRAEERPRGGARGSQSTEKSQRSDWKWKMLVWKKMKKASDQVLARIYCYDWFPQRQKGP